MKRILAVIAIALLTIISCRVDILPESLGEALERTSRELAEEPISVDAHMDASTPFAWVDYPSGTVTFVFNGADWDRYEGQVYVIILDLTGE